MFNNCNSANRKAKRSSWRINKAPTSSNIRLLLDILQNSLDYYASTERLKTVEAIQLVHNLKQNENKNGINIFNAGKWLGEQAC